MRMRTDDELRQIARKVHALSVLKKETGFQTRRTSVELLSGLSSRELIEVSQYVAAMTAKGTNNDNQQPNGQQL